MELIVDGRVIKKFNDVALSLKYNSIADSFAFSIYFDPNNEGHRIAFKPSGYQNCQISHNGELVMMGIIMYHSLSDGAVKELSLLSGYTNTGIFHDCSVFAGKILVKPIELIPQGIESSGTITWQNMSLTQLATEITHAFGYPDPVID